MRLSAPRVVFAAATAASFLFACQLIVGVKDDPGVPQLPDRPPQADGGDGGGLPDVVDRCKHADPPPPPATDEGGDDLKLVFATRKIAIGARTGEAGDAGEEIGFDLDGVCSCENRPPSGGVVCKAPGDPCPPGAPSDDPRGRDLGGINALKPFRDLALLDKSASIDDQLERGQRGFLVVVSGYNGKANDKDVQVLIRLSPGTTVQGACPGSQPIPDVGDGIRRFNPCWDGNDLWSVTNADGTRGLPAYVNNYELVVIDKTGTTDVYLGIGALQIGMSRPIFQATLTPPTGGKWTLNGVLAGRVNAAEALAVLGELVDPLSSPNVQPRPRLCDPSSKTSYGLLRDRLCATRDINYTGEADPAKACDGISFAVGVALEQAKVGAPVTPAPIDAGGCPPAGLLRCDGP